MLRVSKLLNSLERKNSFNKLFKNISKAQSNGYHYQTEIYTNKFENKELNDALRAEYLRVNQNRINQPNLYRFIKSYQEHGYKKSQLDPLKQKNENESIINELDPEFFGLIRDSNNKYPIDGLLNSKESSLMTINEIENYLKNVYSTNMTIEFEFLQSEEEKLWISREFEALQTEAIDNKTRVDLLKLLLKSQAFDQFLGIKFPTFKRYSLEGGESSLAFYQSIFQNAAKSDIEELVMGIAHRGRLNLMICMLNLKPDLLFTKMKGKSEFAKDVNASGDISHHFPCSTDLKYDDKKVHVSLVQNPSHLEAVDPLVLGKARSKQMFLKDGLYSEKPSQNGTKVASFLVHGDAAFCGQGIVSETFQLSKLPNYSVGGTVHLITNNQLGFTTPSNLARSGSFNSDLAKGYNCPIIHVNGDYPELAFKAGQLAMKYRNKFAKDIVVDLVCFRKYGHNELDDPSFTNPLMYKIINSRESVPNNYEKIIVENEKLVDKKNIIEEVNRFRASLDDSLNNVLNGSYKIEPKNTYLNKKWSIMNLASNKDRTNWNTGCSIDLLKYIGTKSVDYPKDFAIHPTVDRAHVKKRLERLSDEKYIDWSTAEALAIGSLLLQGFNVRISGQDVGRGTFSHRHAMLVDQQNSKTFIPLNNLDKTQKNFFEVCNSNLSEEAVMGYDYGFSLDSPHNLVIWEAQFGDFFNGAQIIIDQYISSGEQKWLYQSGLVLLLPHGFDGAGPEHSSARIERFLQMSSSKEDQVDSDDINYYVCHPTTPANYFHLLRRQMIQPFRKPLIMAAPKGLLRLPECVSSLDMFDTDTQFQPVLDDPKIKSYDAVKRVIFVFGKHYYELNSEREKRKLENTAIIRIEELSPFPAASIRAILSKYKNATEYVWAQEEHRNQGGWTFASPRFERVLGVKLSYAGRQCHNTIAGIGALHAAEVKEILAKPFEKL